MHSDSVLPEKQNGIDPQDKFISSYTPHSPILISSDSDFSSQGFPGNGSVTNPYIISGYYISTPSRCIHIENTDVYFIIRDCLLAGDNALAGIQFEYVTNGEIRNNTIIDTYAAVYFWYSSSNRIVNNTITENDDGLSLWYSSNNVLINNTISENIEGISINHDSDNNIVANNNITESFFSNIYLRTSSSNNRLENNTISNEEMHRNNQGVYIFSAPNNILSSNIMKNSGIYIVGYPVDEWHLDISPDNLVNGKPLGYFWNVNDVTIDGSQYGQIILADCTGITVENGVFNQTIVGIQLGFSSGCNLINTTTSSNVYGMKLYSSTGNTIDGNSISGNYEEGMWLAYHSSDNTIMNNNITENGLFGIHVMNSDDTYLQHNNFSSNNGALYIENSMYSIVTNNVFSENRGSGVYISGSSENRIEYNNISGSNYGVAILSSSHNRLEANTIVGHRYGVKIDDSPSNTMIGNIMVNNGIILTGTEEDHWYQRIYTSNLVNEKPVGYFGNLTEGNIDGSQYGQIILANCAGATIENGTFYNATVGINLGYSTDCNLNNNTVIGNDIGINVGLSSGNTFTENRIITNNYGVFIWSNDCSNNLFYQNNLENNANDNAVDHGTNNNWNTTGIGNSWSDYIGTGVYLVPGAAGSIDYHPLFHDSIPPMIDHPLDVEYVEQTYGHSITWISTDENPSHYIVYRNGTEFLSNSWEGNPIIVYVNELSVGIYNYTIVVYDTVGNMNSDTVFVTVLQSGTSTITSTSSTTSTSSNTGTSTTTSIGDLTGLVFTFAGLGGIVLVGIILIVMRSRRAS